MCEHQVVALGGVGPEGLGLLRRSPGFDVADLETQRVTNPLEALIGRRIPGGIGDGTGSDETNPHS